MYHESYYDIFCMSFWAKNAYVYLRVIYSSGITLKLILELWGSMVEEAVCLFYTNLHCPIVLEG